MSAHIPTPPRLSLSLLPICALLFGVACGNDDDSPGADSGIAESADSGTDEGSIDATDIEVWRSYCIATFSESFDVLAFNNDFLFTAEAGDEFVMSQYSDPSDIEATLLHAAEQGPIDFEIEAADFPNGLPFTSSCEPDAVVRHYAAFADVTLYTTEALDTVLCEIPEGTVLPTSGGGYQAIGIPTAGQDATYLLFLGGFETQCGASEGYVNVPSSDEFGVALHNIPLRLIVGPE